jgi:Cdc6-like AAA superfamily ATPase
MDPLSIASGIIAVLQVTNEVIGYLKDTKDAPKELTKICEEAKDLVILLYQLKDLVAEQNSHDTWLQTTSGLTAPKGPLDQYREALEILVPKITGRGLRKVGQVLSWKFSREEVMALLSRIERIKSLVQIALEMDHMFVALLDQALSPLRADYHSALSHAIERDLQVVQTGIADLQLTTSTIIDTSLEIKSDTTALRDETAVRHKHDLMGWICPVDYHVQHRDFIDRHQTGTGQWFLQDAKFQGWDQLKDATLFCPGIPGAGKTIMAALVIDHLLRSQHVADEPVTFIYCNYERQSEQTAKHMLFSILRQITDIQPGVPKLVQDFYTFHNTKRTTPSSDEIKQVVEAVSKNLRGLTIIVDALDECEIRARQEFLSAVEALRRQCEVRLLATSRPLPTVQSHPTFLGKPTLEVKASDEDLEKYIRSRSSELHYRIVSKPDFFDDLVSSTVSAVGGMYDRPFL